MGVGPLDRTPPDPAAFGGKAYHVGWLLQRGHRVPQTWLLPAVEPVPEPEELAASLPDEGPWAVRSSATVEDGFGTSYAGQFATVLDVQGFAAVADAVRTVRTSAVGATATSYRERTGDTEPIAMSVMIQRMVTPRVSGVSFSRNPMTGLNEIVIEAVPGRGDALVDEGLTPERWIERWESWSVRPEENPDLPETVARTIAGETRSIAEAFGSPVDLEWVWDGTHVWWVQLRPITGLDQVTVYSNRISREVMPGMIKPLVWSVNVPVVNRAWIELFTEFIGPNELRPEHLAKAFAYRSYFNMGAIGNIFELLGMPRDALEMLLGLPSDTKPGFRPGPGTLRHLPRMVATIAGKTRYGARIQTDVAELREQFQGFERVDMETLSDSGLLAKIDDLAEVTTRAAYANIVTPLLANVYLAMLRRILARNDIDPDNLDLELSDPRNPYDPNPALHALGTKLSDQPGDVVAEITEKGPVVLPDDLRADFDAFLEHFGHLSDSGNDFSVSPWIEQPESVLRLALDHAATTGGHEAQHWRDAVARCGPVSRRTVQLLQRRTREFVGHREAVSFTYTSGYGLFRPYFLEVGRRLQERGLVERPDDVMYLYADEARTAILDGDKPWTEVVEARRREMEELADVDMPEIIFGDDFVPARHGSEPIERLEGVATSRGRHRGTLRVVKGIDDAPKVQPGDVIAIPYSDVAWTPLFARAGAVIAEAGGMLSHSSIVAREYRVPCVVSVQGATRLPDGATVVVDGYTGTIIVE